MIKNNKIFNSCFKAGGVLFCIFTAVFFTVFGAGVANAQTAMVTSVSTNYPVDVNAEQNYQCDSDPRWASSVSFLYNSYDSINYSRLNGNLDPWHNSALIEFDQPYTTTNSTGTANFYPNHCLQLCANVTCVNPARKIQANDGSSSDSLGIPQDVASSDFPIQSVLFEIFKFQPGSNPYNADTTPPVRTIALTPTDDNVCPGVGTYTTGSGTSERSVSCCELFNGPGQCVNSTCEGWNGSSCPSGCVSTTTTGCHLRDNKYAREFCGKFGKEGCEYYAATTWQAGMSCEWNDTTGQCVERCSSVTSEARCNMTHYRNAGRHLGSPYDDQGIQVCEWSSVTTCTTSSSDDCRSFTDINACNGSSEHPECMWTQSSASSTSISSCFDTVRRFNTYQECSAGITKLNFCTSWDGSYEIDGEFGKSNGQFGFRANVKTKWPGDGISSGGDVDVDHTMAYPGENQIPIQVDVTNVHSVRSSSTMVGTTTKVSAQPYQLTYKLSKDATTTITISDPGEGCRCQEIMVYDSGVTSYGDYYPIQYEHDGGYTNNSCLLPYNMNPKLIRKPFDIVDGKPRLGEGVPDGVNTNLDSWDGRDATGMLLPYGNYLVSITASTRDEWSLGRLGLSNYATPPAPDLSRTVTRQLSLDPLQITDIKETGLAKLSTSYAKIDYVLTEPATVHLMIFTPGTFFTDVDMPGLNDPAEEIVGRILNDSGHLVAHITEQKQSRVNINTKWDGVCQNQNGCVFYTNYDHSDELVYNFGTPLPDGDYVYVLWAEIPYQKYWYGGYQSYARWLKPAVCVNNKWWAGVRTHKYYNGILPINRGLPEITVGAVGYSTLGSSPTAFGLDPFSFNYSVSRDAIVDATIKTTAPDIAGGGDQVYTVKKLLTNEVAVASKQNHFTWDGIDEAGYQVSPGTYMVEFVAKDSLYPEKQATMTVQFPVDMFRVVDVNTTSLLDEATAQATINYTLSKSMDVVVEIYNQNVTIPVNDCTDPDDPEENCWCKFSTTTASTGTPILNHPILR